jgi:hypothetical protein
MHSGLDFTPNQLMCTALSLPYSKARNHKLSFSLLPTYFLAADGLICSVYRTRTLELRTWIQMLSFTSCCYFTLSKFQHISPKSHFTNKVEPVLPMSLGYFQNWAMWHMKKPVIISTFCQQCKGEGNNSPFPLLLTPAFEAKFFLFS